MRKVWLVGGDKSARLQLEQTLNRDGALSDYRVFEADDFSVIPERDHRNPGVVFLLDAFHPKVGGFEGLKVLERLNSQGFRFLIGEPTPEQCVEPFRDFKLAAYLPPSTRWDIDFAAGLIEHQIHYTGELRLARFLTRAGRSSSETIHNFKEFGQFGKTLATFLSRFGCDIPRLKSILMGLCLGHLKNGPQGPHVEAPFVIHYGMDPQKVLLSITTHSKGLDRQAFMQEYCEVLTGLSDLNSQPRALFPEIFHVARSAKNLILLGGSSKSESPSMEPLTLLVGLGFPSVGDRKLPPVTTFGFCSVRSTPEYVENEDVAPSQPDATQVRNVTQAETQPQESVVESAPEVQAQVQVAPVNAPMVLADKDINEILNDEPVVLGDQPQILGDPAGPAPRVVPVEAVVVHQESAPPHELESRLQELNQELSKLKDVNAALAHDVRRLMKERRQPTTDRELRDAVTELQERQKKLLQERAKLKETLDDRDKQIELLKTQVETLRQKKIA